MKRHVASSEYGEQDLMSKSKISCQTWRRPGPGPCIVAWPHDTTLAVGELCDPMCPKCSFVKKKQALAKEMNGLGDAKSEEMHWYGHG